MLVGIPRSLAMQHPSTGAGKIWSNVLPLLGVDVRVMEPHHKAGVDVWLSDGHQGPLDVDKPVVAHLHEAPWGDPEVRATVHVDFIDRIDAQSRAAVHQAAVVLSGSESGRRELLSRYEPQDVRVALNGVDHSVFSPEGPLASPQLIEAGGEPETPYVLFVGSVLPRKNLPLLRRAMADLEAALVVVAGPTFDRPDCSELAAEALAPIRGRRVPNMVGIDDEGLAGLMRGAAVLCCPSVTEGFGLPVLEAMACGTPVVVSNRGALPEVVGDGGIVVEPVLPELVAGLRRALSADRGDLGMRGFHRAAEFTWERTANVVTHALLDAC